MKSWTRQLIGCSSIALIVLGFSLGIGAIERKVKSSSSHQVSFENIKKIVKEYVEKGVLVRRQEEKTFEYREKEWAFIIDTVKAYVEEVSKEKKFLLFRVVSKKDETNFLQLLDDLKICGSAFLWATTELTKDCGGGGAGCMKLFDSYLSMYYDKRTTGELFGVNETKKPDKKEQKRLEEQGKKLGDKGLVPWFREQERKLENVANKDKEPQISVISAILLVIKTLEKAYDAFSFSGFEAQVVKLSGDSKKS